MRSIASRLERTLGGIGLVTPIDRRAGEVHGLRRAGATLFVWLVAGRRTWRPACDARRSSRGRCIAPTCCVRAAVSVLTLGLMIICQFAPVLRQMIFLLDMLGSVGG
jgi:hypothetical protein